MASFEESVSKGLACPFCGAPTVLERLDGRFVLICHPCSAWASCVPNKTYASGPIVKHTPIDYKLEAYRYFDAICKRKMEKDGTSYTDSRNIAFKWLATQMNIPPEYTHMSLFSNEQLQMVIQICKKYVTLK